MDSMGYLTSACPTVKAVHLGSRVEVFFVFVFVWGLGGGNDVT